MKLIIPNLIKTNKQNVIEKKKKVRKKELIGDTKKKITHQMKKEITKMVKKNKDEFFKKC